MSCIYPCMDYSVLEIPPNTFGSFVQNQRDSSLRVRLIHYVHHTIPLCHSVHTPHSVHSVHSLHSLHSPLPPLLPLPPLSPLSPLLPSLSSTSPYSPPIMTSDILSYFLDIVVKKGRGSVEDRRQCGYCEQSYSMATSQTVLRQHIDNKHGGFPPPSPSSSSSSSVCLPPSKKRTMQSTLDQTTLFINNEALRPALAALFARCSWAHQAVDFPEFLAVIIAARSSTCPPPNRHPTPSESIGSRTEPSHSCSPSTSLLLSYITPHCGHRWMDRCQLLQGH